jgi:hypothetical protein
MATRQTDDRRSNWDRKTRERLQNSNGTGRDRHRLIKSIDEQAHDDRSLSRQAEPKRETSRLGHLASPHHRPVVGFSTAGTVAVRLYWVDGTVDTEREPIETWIGILVRTAEDGSQRHFMVTEDRDADGYIIALEVPEDV